MPLKTWVSYRDKYLDHLMELEGRRGLGAKCPGCKEESPTFRCRDCFGGVIWCKSCFLLRHDQSPLHSIEVSKVSLTVSSSSEFSFSAGMEHTLLVAHYKQSASEYSLGILQAVAATTPIRPTSTSLSYTLRVFTKSPSTTVVVTQFPSTTSNS